MFPSSYRRLRRALALTLVAIGILAPLGLRALGHEAALLDAQEYLMAGEVQKARDIYRRLAAWGHLRTDALAGLAVGNALQGDSPSFIEMGRLEPEALSRLPLPVLMRSSLVAGQPEGTLALTRLAQRAGLTSADLYRSAALVEMGRSSEVHERPTRSDGLSGRLADALDLLERGVRTIVRDRNGAAIGIVDPEGIFHFESGVDPLLVPRAVIEELERSPREGVIRLAIDLELSKLAFKALRYHQGSVVVLDSWTGDILAAVSDKKGYRRGGTPAFEEKREPASISKIITTSAALRAGVDPDETIADLRCRGAVQYNGEYVWCPSRGGRLRTLDRALAKSCNVAFAKLGHQVGRKALVDELRRFGFSNDTDLGAGLASGEILQASGNDRQLADLSIGLEATDVTPLHAALIASVLANDGVMPRARLFTATDGPLGLSSLPLPISKGRRVLDPSFIPTISQAMESVVKAGGTAAKVAPDGFPVIMKTGTGAQYPWGYHVNYIGVGPHPNPRLAFAVRITRKRSSRSARQAGYDTTKRLLRALRDLELPRSTLGLDLAAVPGEHEEGGSPHVASHPAAVETTKASRG